MTKIRRIRKHKVKQRNGKYPDIEITHTSFYPMRKPERVEALKEIQRRRDDKTSSD